MTQEEFLKEYSGKFIEISGFETVWIFEVNSADFSRGNENFLGWIAGKRIIIGGSEVIEKYHDPQFEKDEIILRPEDKITVYPDKETLGKRIFEFLQENLIKYENDSRDNPVPKK